MLATPNSGVRPWYAMFIAARSATTAISPGVHVS